MITNKQIIEKMTEDMEMRGFSKWTKESYLSKTKDIIKYFNKPMEKVKIEELREFLLKHLREERRLSERSVNIFKYRDYKDNKKIKEMTLKAEEFSRRFLMHILPPRFMKIRHYGLLGNRNKST